MNINPAAITPLILALSAIAAFAAIWRNQVIARKRATIDLVLAQKADEILKKNKEVLSKLYHENKDCLAQYAAGERKDSNEAKAILGMLNYYEFISSGIHENAFCERTYKRMVYGIVVQDYEALKGFIQEVRRSRKHDTLFQEFEWLGRKWKKKPLKKNHRDQ